MSNTVKLYDIPRYGHLYDIPRSGDLDARNGSTFAKHWRVKAGETAER